MNGSSTVLEHKRGSKEQERLDCHSLWHAHMYERWEFTCDPKSCCLRGKPPWSWGSSDCRRWWMSLHSRLLPWKKKTEVLNCKLKMHIKVAKCLWAKLNTFARTDPGIGRDQWSTRPRQRKAYGRRSWCQAHSMTGSPQLDETSKNLELCLWYCYRACLYEWQSNRSFSLILL